MIMIVTIMFSQMPNETNAIPISNFVKINLLLDKLNGLSEEKPELQSVIGEVKKLLENSGNINQSEIGNLLDKLESDIESNNILDVLNVLKQLRDLLKDQQLRNNSNTIVNNSNTLPNNSVTFVNNLSTLPNSLSSVDI